MQQIEQPHCVSIFRGDKCDLARQQYQTAIRERAQQIIADQRAQAAADASNQKQAEIESLNSAHEIHVLDLQKQILKLQSEKTFALKGMRDANQQVLSLVNQPTHEEGMHEGEFMGAGFMLAAFLLLRGSLFLVRNFKISRNERSRAAAA